MQVQSITVSTHQKTKSLMGILKEKYHDSDNYPPKDDACFGINHFRTPFQYLPVDTLGGSTFRIHFRIGYVGTCLFWCRFLSNTSGRYESVSLLLGK